MRRMADHIRATVIGGAVAGGALPLLAGVLRKRPMSETAVQTVVGSALGAGYYGGVAYVANKGAFGRQFSTLQIAGAGAAVGGVGALASKRTRKVVPVVLSAAIGGGVTGAVAYWNRPVVLTVTSTDDTTSASPQIAADAAENAAIAAQGMRAHGYTRRHAQPPGVFG